MIQFNLLPDVKLEYIRAQRSRSLVITVAIVVCVISIASLILLLSVDALQKKHLSDLTKDIQSETSTLQKKPDINTILTVQNQLASLTSLHDGKPAAGRLFNYLNSVTPAPVSITTLDVDYGQYTMTISGTADSLSSVNKYIDTLKLTRYRADKDTTDTRAFSDVVLSSFSLSSTADPSQAASYTITLTYDKTIFDTTKVIVLSVPTVTTRAQLQNPTDLFKASTSGGTQ